MRLQIRYKSLKATSTNGTANVDVRETEPISSVMNRNVGSNRIDNICNGCDLQKILLALGICICLIIVGVIVGVILNDQNNEATSTTSTTTLHWSDPDYSP